MKNVKMLNVQKVKNVKMKLRFAIKNRGGHFRP